MRFSSNQTNLNDYVKGLYVLDLGSQRLTPTRFDVYKDVGVYDEVNDILIKDVPDRISIYEALNSSIKYPEGRQYKITSGLEISMDLKVGQRLRLRLDSVQFTGPFKVVLTSPIGTVFDRQFQAPIPSNGYIISEFIPVLIPGVYKFRLTSVLPSKPFAYLLSFTNENFSVATVVRSGMTLTATLNGGVGGAGLPYQKYKVNGEVGKTMSLPLDADTAISVINSRGGCVYSPTNVGVNYKFVEAGDHYIVIQSGNQLNESVETYRGVLTVR